MIEVTAALTRSFGERRHADCGHAPPADTARRRCEPPADARAARQCRRARSGDLPTAPAARIRSSWTTACEPVRARRFVDAAIARWKRRLTRAERGAARQDVQRRDMRTGSRPYGRTEYRSTATPPRYGWFLDATPLDDSEFGTVDGRGSPHRRRAGRSRRLLTPAAERATAAWKIAIVGDRSD